MPEKSIDTQVNLVGPLRLICIKPFAIWPFSLQIQLAYRLLTLSQTSSCFSFFFFKHLGERSNFSFSQCFVPFLYARWRRDVLCDHLWQAGGVPHSLSGAYLQDYATYGYEILWVDRSYQGGVQCMWTVTLACLIFKLLPFVYFHTWILSRAYLQNYTSYGYEILWVDRSHQEGVQCIWTVTLACLFFELLPFVYFHTWILSGAYLQDYTSYGYEISWMVTTWGKTGIFCDNLPLLFEYWTDPEFCHVVSS